MRYILLIYGNEAAEATMSEEEQKAMFEAYTAYSQELQAAGVHSVADALLPTSAATTVRVREGKALTTHGPFAETAEQLGGYYVITCENLDEALAWAAKIPGAKTGSVEVRPLMEF
jgi:hypothetical protein